MNKENVPQQDAALIPPTDFDCRRCTLVVTVREQLTIIHPLAREMQLCRSCFCEQASHLYDEEDEEDESTKMANLAITARK